MSGFQYITMVLTTKGTPYCWPSTLPKSQCLLLKRLATSSSSSPATVAKSTASSLHGVAHQIVSWRKDVGWILPGALSGQRSSPLHPGTSPGWDCSNYDLTRDSALNLSTHLCSTSLFKPPHLCQPRSQRESSRTNEVLTPKRRVNSIKETRLCLFIFCFSSPFLSTFSTLCYPVCS